MSNLQNPSYRVIIGDEYDDALRDRLVETLRGMQAQRIGFTSGGAGSQDVDEWSYKIGDEFIQIIAETYIGLTVIGSEDLVKEIKRRTEII
jgi:hypothetical protein